MDEKYEREALCPKCHLFDYHYVLERLPRMLDIPPRVVLRCVDDSCKQVFYRSVVNGH